MQRWVERAEAGWALWAGLAGAFVTLVASAWRILAEGTAMAGLSFVFVPLVAAVVAVPAAVWGAALGHVVLHLRGRAAEPKIVFWAALAAALMPPAALAYYCVSNIRL
jgi:hypothetical protein